MKILFVCTHNRCRSILSEAIAQQRAGDVIEARSAGSQPAREVHPLTLKYLAEAGYSTAGLQSQSWEDFAGFAPDLVITVCDAAAGEACPLYLGGALKMHWGLSDPSKIEGDTAAQAAAFNHCIEQVEGRVAILARLARDGVGGAALREALEQEGATG
ncbi:arsenate reductase ArsC [Parahaliea maris]|uniref:Arsenate reductase ArsC n=1 Tax=Parahaliea maris TaxID=2716870 RepID=A0A5C9A273_9GAMM|nr:arsenate reductase ArsC [Parahaliea maris]TXS94104.1 arsenate reductase ArsC [Parahaliea maris]